MIHTEIYPAITPIEHKIKLLLVMKGYKRDDIEFFFDEAVDEENYIRMLRIGNYNYIKDGDISYVEKHCPVKIEYEEWYNQDCGWQSVYYFKTKTKEA
tara:strand:+ start:530 stop:823 length:294 start_codon:yes stop_codon:yes gene_type:complete